MILWYRHIKIIISVQIKKTNMQIEVCAFSVESCLNAQQAGAHRVELCGGLYEGGTTPSYGLIEHAKKVLSIDIYVMIRPRGGDFCYDDDEYEVMKYDIEAVKKLGVKGVVLGILKPNGEIDVIRTAELVSLAKPMSVTFHRAFDMAISPLDALEAVIETGAIRILTSGQQNNAFEGQILIQELVQKAQGRIEIMAGSGVNADNALSLSKTGVNALHLTGKSVRNGQMNYQKKAINMASTLPANEYEVIYSDIKKISDVVEALH